jgi:heme a synthase
MNRPAQCPRGLSRFAACAALASLLLIAVGGTVTSHQAGMAVPDWPTTNGYNMFLFPVSKWTGGILYEHVHRLFASAVGLVTVLLALWLWLRERRAWVRWLGLLAVVLVTAQGVLGGLRVTQRMDELGIVHAALAQFFLVLMSALALFTSHAWSRLPEMAGPKPCGPALARWSVALTLLIFLQLLLAATMRHQHAGLAIPDFPTAYGRWWPDMGAEAVARYNQARVEVTAQNPITAFQIELHMAHRLLAFGILGGVAVAAWRVRRTLGGGHLFARVALGWLGLILVQVALGAATVLTQQSPTVATLHVVGGALALVAGSLGTLALWRWSATLHEPTALAGRDAFHCVPELFRQAGDAVERAPTRFMAAEQAAWKPAGTP